MALTNNHALNYLRIMGDPTMKDELRLKTTQELAENFETYINHGASYKSFIEHSMKTFIKILQEDNIQFISEYNIQQVSFQFFHQNLIFYILSDICRLEN